MAQMELRERLLADIESLSDEAVVVAAKELFALGEYGSPAGAYPLKGGQAAFRLARWADSATLLYQGIEVSGLHTRVWTECHAGRSIACTRLGIYPTAVFDGGLFLSHVHKYPELAKWVPHVHHAMGQSRDRMRQYAEAVPHHRQAAEHYSDPPRRAQAVTNWAYSLALSGSPDEAEQVLDQVTDAEDRLTQFALRFTLAVIRYFQGRFAVAITEAEQAEQLAQGHEEAWAVPLLEIRYWLARAVWATGDGVRAARLGLYVAVMAQQHWQTALADDATDLLVEIRSKGGLSNA